MRAHFLLILLMLAAVVFAGQQGLEAVLVFSMWFGLILLHELGHCVVARRFGIRVIDITLWPLGGMARMSEIPESSRVEGWIAIAGPAVNFALVVLALPFWGWAAVARPEWSGAVEMFVLVNLMMGGFNLLPVFPADGGRLLRAWLGRRGDWLGATESAVSVGRVFSLGLAATGLVGIPGVLPQNFMLPLIALFLWWVGSQELMMVRMRHARGPFRVFADLLRRARMAERRAAREREAFAAEEHDARPETREEGRGYTDGEVEALERYRGSIRR